MKRLKNCYSWRYFKGGEIWTVFLNATVLSVKLVPLIFPQPPIFCPCSGCCLTLSDYVFSGVDFNPRCSCFIPLGKMNKQNTFSLSVRKKLHVCKVPLGATAKNQAASRNIDFQLFFLSLSSHSFNLQDECICSMGQRISQLKLSVSASHEVHLTVLVQNVCFKWNQVVI